MDSFLSYVQFIATIETQLKRSKKHLLTNNNTEKVRQILSQEAIVCIKFMEPNFNMLMNNYTRHPKS